MWDISHLELNSTSVSLFNFPLPSCSTCRLSFHSDHCTCSYLNVQPYPGFNPDELHEYVFVSLPTLQRRFIDRQLTSFEGEEQEVATYKLDPPLQTLRAG